jgi:hypothetical protein
MIDFLIEFHKKFQNLITFFSLANHFLYSKKSSKFSIYFKNVYLQQNKEEKNNFFRESFIIENMSQKSVCQSIIAVI